jgi:hypothetical protein
VLIRRLFHGGFLQKVIDQDLGGGTVGRGFPSLDQSARVRRGVA